MKRFSAREVVSQTDLDILIKDNWSFNAYQRELRSKIVEGDDLLFLWKENLYFQCKKLAKMIQTEFHNYGFLYNELEQKNSQIAVLLTEIFRNRYIAKNCANLDLQNLKKLFLKQISNKKIKFMIAWGHSKRDCSKLKTQSYCADFAELYAISVLFLITKTANLLSNLPIEITVLSGGLRFYNSLFANPKEIELYNKQRSMIANFLCDDSVSIEFKEYEPDSTELNKIDAISKNISQHSIDNKFKTILCNIDWRNIFINNLTPHGIHVEITDKLYNPDVLIAGAISLILNPNTKYDFEKIIDPKLLQKIVTIMRDITKISTKKYLATHLSNMNVFSPENNIRLSVHLKPDRTDIPVIYTLGLKGGNKLSQHSMMVIGPNSKINFITNYEAKLCNYIQVVNSHSKLFDWCGNNAMFFVENYNDDIRRFVQSIQFIPFN